MWLSGCVLGEEDVAGVCALPCRTGETHSSMHAQHAGSSRVRRVRFHRLCEIATRGVFSREAVISHMPGVKSQGV